MHHDVQATNNRVKMICIFSYLLFLWLVGYPTRKSHRQDKNYDVAQRRECNNVLSNLAARFACPRISRRGPSAWRKPAELVRRTLPVLATPTKKCEQA